MTTPRNYGILGCTTLPIPIVEIDLYTLHVYDLDDLDVTGLIGSYNKNVTGLDSQKNVTPPPSRL